MDINMEFRKGILFVRLSGILNYKTGDTLKQKLKYLIKEQGIKYVLINIININYIDNYGLKVIFDNNKLLKKNNGKLILCGFNNNFFAKSIYQVSNELNAFKVINI